MSETWRSRYPVLVTEAQAMGSIGVIRSLGRGGYPVHACATKSDALGLHSNYCGTSTICPDYNDPSFSAWLREYIEKHGIRAVIPSEGFLIAIRPVFSEFSGLLPYTQPKETLYAGMSKADQFEALSLGPGKDGPSNHVPPSFVVVRGKPSLSVHDLERLGKPLFLKVDGCYGEPGGDSAVHSRLSVRSAAAEIAELTKRYEKVLVQGAVPGRGVGAFFLMWKGQLLGQFMHLRLHEVPYTGGASSYRKSWWHAGIHEDALEKLKRLHWEGVAMMEYRWDPTTDEFYFLEMNGRFWGSIHLALFAGVDFPLLLLDAFHGHAPAPVVGPREGVRCRYTFPREVQYVWSCLKSDELPLLTKVWTILEFLLLSMNPWIHSDLLYPGDTKLYWRKLREQWKQFGR